MKGQKSGVKYQRLFVGFISLGIFFTLSLPPFLLGEEPASQGKPDLGQAFINAYESNDEAKMKSLIKENKNLVSKELVNMVNYATSDQVSEKEMIWLIKISGKMANIYSAEFSDKKLENFIANYKKWSKKEQDKKQEAVRVFFAAKKDLKNKDYEAVVEKWNKSLDKCMEIGDLLSWAQWTEEIGLTYGKLGSFETSIRFFDDARQAHRDIGNSWGEYNALRYIATGYIALEDYEKAIETYNSALNIINNLEDNAQKDILLKDIELVETKMKSAQAQ